MSSGYQIFHETKTIKSRTTKHDGRWLNKVIPIYVTVILLLVKLLPCSDMSKSKVLMTMETFHIQAIHIFMKRQRHLKLVI